VQLNDVVARPQWILPSLVVFCETTRNRKITAAETSEDKEVNFHPTIQSSFATRFETNNFANLFPCAAYENTLDL
jgi:hypothetical protein